MQKEWLIQKDLHSWVFSLVFLSEERYITLFNMISSYLVISRWSSGNYFSVNTEGKQVVGNKNERNLRGV